MADDRTEATCPVCGRPLIRRVTEYELGRRGSAPVRWIGKWWHAGTDVEACAAPEIPDA